MRALALLTLATLLFADANLQNKELSAKEIEKQNITIAKLAAQEITKSLPQIIDKYTTITACKAEKNSLIYLYEIKSKKSDETIQKEDHSKMGDAITKGTCTSSQRFLESNISITHQYISATSKKKLFEFHVNQENCPKR